MFDFDAYCEKYFLRNDIRLVLDGRRVGTDGHIAIRLNDVVENEASPHRLAGRVAEIFADAERLGTGEWKELEWGKPEMIACPSCEGTGYLDEYIPCPHCKGQGHFDCPCDDPDCRAEYECHRCDGNKEIKHLGTLLCPICLGGKTSPVDRRLENITIAGPYLVRLFALPGPIEYQPPKSPYIKTLYFRFSGGDGVLRGLDY